MKKFELWTNASDSVIEKHAFPSELSAIGAILMSISKRTNGAPIIFRAGTEIAPDVRSFETATQTFFLKGID